MQGRKNTELKLFCTVSIDALVPSDHPVRRIAKVLDLKFLYGETRSFYSNEGRPSIDPVVLFKLYIIAYFFGIASERRLMKEVQVNLAYRWYLGYDLEETIPDHSVLTKARRRFPESVFALLFTRVIAQCRTQGLITGDMHFVDSSLIHADASKESFSKELPRVTDFLKRIDIDNDDTTSQNKKRSYMFDGTVDPRKMGKRRKTEKKNDRLRSSTDPQSQLITRPGKGTFAAYKAHLAVDRKRRVILSISGSAATEDDMSKVDALFTGASLSAGKKPKVIVADKHYGGIEALKYYQDHNVDTCIHPRISDTGKGRYRNSDFTVNSDETNCHCPAGRAAVKKIRNKFRVQFRFDPKDCHSCGVRWKCTDSPGGRMITYYRGGYFTRAARLAGSPKGQRLLRIRQIIVEGVIGEAKNIHGLRRCRYRGLANFQIQLFLTATVINLKRLMQKPGLLANPAVEMLDTIRLFLLCPFRSNC